MNSGSEPITKSPAIINPHAAVVTGFLSTTLADVRIATPAPTLRSSSSGNDTTLIINTTTANRKPTPLPTTISVHPSGVVKTWRRKFGIDPGGELPKVAM
jgi:hypothetical protein